MKLSLFCITLSAVFALNCHTITTSPPSTGSIAGRVILYDSNQHVMTDHSGIHVSIDGTSKSMVTDSTGNWLFTGLAEGMYDVTASKPGFGAYHWYEQNVNNARTYVQPAALANLPVFTSTVFNASFDGTNLIVTVSNYGSANSPAPLCLDVACYLDKDSSVQPSDPHILTDGYYAPSANKLYFSYTDLLALGVRPGQTLYLSSSLAFRGGSQFFSTTFDDPAHNNEFRYASNGPKSNVVVVTMP